MRIARSCTARSLRFWGLSLFVAVPLALAGCGRFLSAGDVTARRATIIIPTYTWGPHDINPHFEPATSQPSIYPYPMQDNLGREKADKRYEALVLENEYLRVTVLPELGGHVHSVYDKVAGREMFYLNKVVKPGLIGMAGAWISGGIEFNTGPMGHTVTAVYPVSCTFVDHGDGGKSIAIGHVERIYRTQWMAEVRLRPGRRFLEERIRIYNPQSTPAWYYFWNCTAVPNTDGMEFIYPTRLMTDHGYTKFYPWPVNEGKDLRWSKVYDEPTGPFAYECAADFFGSYDHDIDYGLVAVANHHELKGKKGWTWGRGGDGITAMSTLTDDGSWYNEIQTGPLQTQADVGVLGPHQTIEWKEWWCPVQGLDGYEYATKDVAVNVFPYVPWGGEAKEPVCELRILATGRFSDAVCVVSKDGREVLRRPVKLRPEGPAKVELPAGVAAPIRIEITAGGETLASFVHPLPLPDRQPPAPAAKDKKPTPTSLWREGLKLESQGGLKAARGKYEEAIEKQGDFSPAMKALAVLDLRSGLWEQAAGRLDAAIKINPEDGMAHYLRAEAAIGMDDDGRALDEAWKAAKLADTTAIGLNLAAQVYIRQDRWTEAEDALKKALRHDGEDISSWSLLSLVFERMRRQDLLAWTCEQIRDRDPLDPRVALLLLPGPGLGLDLGETLGSYLRAILVDPQTPMEMAARLIRLKQYAHAATVIATRLGIDMGLDQPGVSMLIYADRFSAAQWACAPHDLHPQRDLPAAPDYEWPFRLEEIPILQDAVKRDPKDARAWYLLGNVFFSRQRYDEARKAWDQAAALGLQYSVLYRNIGMAKDRLDGDAAGAIAAYEKAHSLNPHDQVVMRDLGRLYKKREQWDKVVSLLEKSLSELTYRGDLIEDLVRAYEHRDELEKAAALLDSRTFNQWEGQQSLHDIFEIVHRRLGEQAMGQKDLAVAVREFKRSMEYPKNLGAGKPKGKSQAQGLYLLGEAYAAAGRAVDARKVWQRAADEGEKGGEFAKKAAAAMASRPVP